MNGWKKMAAAGISSAMILAAALPAYAGQWQFDGPEFWQWKYVEDDGTYPVNTWKEVDGKWYHLDANGYRDVNWHSYPETETYLNWDGTTRTEEVYRWYHFDENGVMDTQGQWEGGFIQADGRFLVDTPYYDSMYSLIEYERRLPVKNEAGVITDYTNGTYYGALTWTRDFAKQWCGMIYDAVEERGNTTGQWDMTGEWKTDFQVPQNWMDECPNPLLEKLIQSPFIDTDAGTYYWTDWYVDDNFVLHVAVSCEYNFNYLTNPELVPRKLYDRTTGVWVVQ